MKLKYSIQNGNDQIDFDVNPETGSLNVSVKGGNINLEIPHKVAIELIEMIRFKLYDHQVKSESIFKRLFQ
jgi:uncharacterized FlaG/YvyC family protein